MPAEFTTQSRNLLIFPASPLSGDAVSSDGTTQPTTTAIRIALRRRIGIAEQIIFLFNFLPLYSTLMLIFRISPEWRCGVVRHLPLADSDSSAKIFLHFNFLPLYSTLILISASPPSGDAESKPEQPLTRVHTGCASGHFATVCVET